MPVACCLLLLACSDASDSSPATLGPTVVQYGTGLGLFDLAVARADAGRTVVAWTEGDFAQGDPAWLALGDTEVRRAVFDPPEVGRVLRRWGALHPIAGGFVRWEARFGADGTWLLSELWLDPEGAFVEFHQRPSTTVRLLTKLETLAFGDRTVVFGVDLELAIVAEVRTPGEDGSTSVVEIDPITPARWALEAAQVDADTAVVAWVGFTDTPTQTDLRQHLAWIDGLPDTPTVTVFHGETPVPGELLDLATTTDETVGTLWLTTDGALRLFSASERGEMDLDTPVLETGDERIETPALLAAGERFVVTFTVPGDSDRDTRAVIVHPATGEATDTFCWPLRDEDGPAAYGPREGGLDWAQVGPCQGQGCAENWLSTGTIELSP